MSYQGNQDPRYGNGSWPSQGPPAQYNPQHLHPQHSHSQAPPQMPPQTPQNGNRNYTPNRNHQSWEQNSQFSSPAIAMYPSNQMYQQSSIQRTPQQFPSPAQYISPAQLMQQPPLPPRPSQQYQRAPVQGPSSQQAPMSTPRAIPRAPSNPSINRQPDMPNLLVSLAEEYFTAAHDLAPSIAPTMTDAGVNTYTNLIATGLGCLDTALKHTRIAPRLEATIRLRFAGVLFEETNNPVDAELTLTKGIALCERNHYYDLKYAMQFLLIQIMAQKNRKVAMKALDSHIADSQAYQHYPWVYVFRFFRSSYAMQSGTISDNHAAVQNLQAIANIASQQGDDAIHLLASLMEAAAHLKTTSPESLELVQRAIAAARRTQLQPDCNIPQLLNLINILDLASAIKQGNDAIIRTKLKAMQTALDESLKDPSWGHSEEPISIPINRTSKSSQVISQDTKAILGIGNDGRDTLMMSSLSRRDVYSITSLLIGIVLLHKHEQKDPIDDHNLQMDDRLQQSQGLKYLQAGLETVEAQLRQPKLSSGVLSDHLSKRQWRGQLSCYFRMYMGFAWAGVGHWHKLKGCLDGLETTMRNLEEIPARPFDYLLIFLKGIYLQGSGDLEGALHIFRDPKLQLSELKISNLSSAEQVERDIRILAGLSRLWILQDGQRADRTQNTALIEELEPLCKQHPNIDIQTAFHLTVASLQTEPPVSLLRIKNELKGALNGAQATANVHFLCITLGVMFSRFFIGVVGEQALKSASAAAVQAGKTRNTLWMSVNNGLLAGCYEVQGAREEAQWARGHAEALAEQSKRNK